MRCVQITPSVTLNSYTFFKSLDLSRSDNKKNILINANILLISFIIHYLIYSTPISKSKKKSTALSPP